MNGRLLLAENIHDNHLPVQVLGTMTLNSRKLNLLQNYALMTRLAQSYKTPPKTNAKKEIISNNSLLNLTLVRLAVLQLPGSVSY